VKKPCIVALAGKGGTGKTTASALLITSLIEMGITPILAVDADPNANLHEALGIEIRETLGSMREEAFTKSIPLGMSRAEFIKYRFRQVLVESNGFDLVAMGRPEGMGCYCFANNLISESMRHLEDEYCFVVIDTEAGMEHISRGTIGKPHILLILSDPTARGLHTALRIRDIAISIGIEDESIYLVVNRFKSGIARVLHGPLKVLAQIPEDIEVENSDLQGAPISSIPRDSSARTAVQQLARSVLEICETDYGSLQ